MAKNYNPPPKINQHSDIRMLNDRQAKTEAKMIRVDAIKFTIEVIGNDKDMSNIISEAKKVEDYIEYGTVPMKIEK